MLAVPAPDPVSAVFPDLDASLLLPDDHSWAQGESGGEASLGNYRNTPQTSLRRKIGVVEPPVEGKLLPADLARLKAYDRRKYRYKLARALARVNIKLGIKHGMNSCAIYAGFSGEKDDEGRKLRHKSINIEARYNEASDSVYLHHTHLAHCGGVFVCPICSSMIRSTRYQEVHEICDKMIKKGYRVSMITLTARHDFNTNLADFMGKFSGAWFDMNKNHKFTDLRSFVGIDHYVRSAEVTLDDIDSSYVVCAEVKPSGWHFHYHLLFFYKINTDNVDLTGLDKDQLKEKLWELEDEQLDKFANGYYSFVQYKNKTEKVVFKFNKGIKELWVEALNKRGLSAEYDVAVNISRMNKDLSDEQNAAKAAKYICKDAAFEMSNAGGSKQGRKKARISLDDLRERVAFGSSMSPHYKWYCAKWVEFVTSIKAVHFMDFSTGLRKECEIEIKEDEDILHGDNGDVVLKEFFTDRTGSSEYASIAYQGNQGYFLNALEKIFERKNLKDFVKKVKDNKGKIEKKDIKLMFPHDEKVAIDDFIRKSIELAQSGIDIEPTCFDENKQPVYSYFDPDSVSMRSYYDKRLPDMIEGEFLRVPQSYSDIAGVVLERIAARFNEKYPDRMSPDPLALPYDFEIA